MGWHGQEGQSIEHRAAHPTPEISSQQKEAQCKTDQRVSGDQDRRRDPPGLGSTGDKDSYFPKRHEEKLSEAAWSSAEEG